MSKERDPECATRPNPNFPKRIARIAQCISSQNSGPFALFHADFGDHNILVDDEYNVVGVIDWVDARVLPIEFCAIYPDHLYTLPEIFWRGSPMESRIEERAKKTYELQRMYLEDVCEAERKNGYEQKLSASLDSYNSVVALCLQLYSDSNQNHLEKLLDEKFNEHSRKANQLFCGQSVPVENPM
jgi:Phosphotransferase enzyme family